MSVIYKIANRIIVVPPGMTRTQLIREINRDFVQIDELRGLAHPLTYSTGGPRLRSPWTLEYADRTPCTLVKP